jgi:hypothetical protein
MLKLKSRMGRREGLLVGKGLDISTVAASAHGADLPHLLVN